MLKLMDGNLKSKLALLLVTACWAAAGQPVDCDGDLFNCTDGYYCDKAVFMCRRCLDCAEFNRSPPADITKCITSVVDCGECFKGLTEDGQGLQCAPAPASRAYVWVAIALAGLVLFAAVVALVVYVLRNTDTFRVFSSTTSLTPGCGAAPAASAPAPPPPYNTLYAPVRPDSPPAPLPLPPHFTDEETSSPFIKRSLPQAPAPAREAAGNQEANLFNPPHYVRGPHLPTNHQTAEREPEPEYLHDETTAESPWRPDDAANNSTHGDNSESGSSSASEASGSGAAPLAAKLAAARATTLLRAPGQDAPPSKVPRLREDTNNNNNNNNNSNSRAWDEEGRRGAGGGATFNILVNVQQLNDVKL